MYILKGKTVANANNRKKCRDTISNLLEIYNSRSLRPFSIFPRCVTREFRTRSPVVENERWSVVPISPTLDGTWERLFGLIPKLTCAYCSGPAPPGPCASFMQKFRPFIARPDPRSVRRGRTAETFSAGKAEKGLAAPRESGHEKSARVRWRGSRSSPTAEDEALFQCTSIVTH